MRRWFTSCCAVWHATQLWPCKPHIPYVNITFKTRSKASTSVQDGIEALQRWRKAAASRHGLTAFAVVALIILAAAGFRGYQSWRINRLYGSAVAALDAAEWAKARAELQQLISLDSSYEDTLI